MMKKFGVRDQIGYAFGDVASTAMTIMQSYFLIFCTYVLGISPEFMAGLFFVAKIWDAINDPLIGQIPDHHLLGKSGDRFKPYVKLGIFPMALFIVCMYADVSSWGSMLKHVWVCIVHVGAEMSYTLCTMPFGAMSSVITTDPVERTKLSRARTMGSSIMGMILMMGIPLVMFDSNGQYITSSFFWLAVGCAIIMGVSFTLLTKLTTERIHQSRPAGEKFNYWKVLKSIVKNRPLLGVMLATLGSLVLLTGTGSLQMYLFKEYFMQPKLMSVIGFVNFPLMLIAFPLAPIFVNKFGKKKTITVSLVSSLIFFLIMLLFPTKNVYLYIALYTCASFGQGIFTMIGWALVTDCVDYQEYKTGERNDGSIFSVYAFSRKLGGAIASTLGAAAVGWAGFDTVTQIQAPDFGANIRVIICALPVVATIVMIIGIGWIFNLSTEESDKISKELAQRRAAEQACQTN